MATNKVFERGVALRLPVGSTILSGQPCIVGNILGVAATDYSATDTAASVDREGVYNLTVNAVNDAGNVAVAAGDAIYYVGTDAIVLSKKKSGRFFGYAMDAVTSGSNAVIRVILAQQPIAGLTDMGIFISAVQTGTGSAQNIAHGLGRVPNFVIAVPVDLSPATVGQYTATEGAHTTTNVVITVTTGKTYKVIAI